MKLELTLVLKELLLVKLVTLDTFLMDPPLLLLPVQLVNLSLLLQMAQVKLVTSRPVLRFFVLPDLVYLLVLSPALLVWLDSCHHLIQ